MAEQGRKIDESTASTSVRLSCIVSCLLTGARMDRHKQPLVYFVSAIGANAIKIGFTTDLGKRLKELETGSPFELLPVAAIFGPASLECCAHGQLNRYRIRGEWFADVDAVWEYIEIHAHYILGKGDSEPATVPLSKIHEKIAMPDCDAHAGLLIQNIREAFNSSALNSRQRKILCMRFGLDGDVPAMSLCQIGEAMGLTHQRVRQIEAASLAKLRTNRQLLDLAG